MIPKLKLLERLMASGVVAVVRAENAEQAKKIADACIKGGIAAIEITFTVPGAAEVIKELAATYKQEELILGAGTVLDSETARLAILAGAQYVVCPSLNVETVKLCNRYQVPCMPGAQTIREIVEAMEAGADIVKQGIDHVIIFERNLLPFGNFAGLAVGTDVKADNRCAACPRKCQPATVV